MAQCVFPVAPPAVGPGQGGHDGVRLPAGRRPLNGNSGVALAGTYPSPRAVVDAERAAIAKVRGEDPGKPGEDPRRGVVPGLVAQHMGGPVQGMRPRLGQVGVQLACQRADRSHEFLGRSLRSLEMQPRESIAGLDRP